MGRKVPNNPARKYLNEHIISYWAHKSGINRARLALMLKVSEATLDKILANPASHITPRQVLILTSLLGKPLNVMIGVIYAGLNSVDAVSYMKGEVLPEVPKFDISEEGKPFGQ